MNANKHENFIILDRIMCIQYGYIFGTQEREREKSNTIIYS